jgi:hypothetical protein
MPIEVPPLANREAELPRIVQAYANDAIAELGTGPSCFSDNDCEWVMKHGAASLSEIEKATLRIVAVNMSGNVPRAAKRLRMAYVSLLRWLRRREAIPHFAMDRNP